MQSERGYNPGPGAYDQHSMIGRESPMISIKGKQEINIRSNIPGPGSYNANPENVRKKVISYKLGTSGRDFEKVSSSIQDFTPGPGTYNQDSRLGKEAPSISIKGRTDLNFTPTKSRTPGPG